MGFSDYKDFIGTTASICTILQLLVPIWMCRKYINDGTTGDSSSLPFAVGFLSSSLWLKYGMLLGESSLIVVNSIGVLLQLCYLGVFYKYSPKKSLVLKQLSAVGLIQVLTLLYTNIETDEDVVLYRVGLLCCLMTVMFFAAPLSQLAHIIQTKSAESLPFQLIVTTFVSSFLWLIYGFMIQDPFVQIPNILGTSLSALQLSLFVIYPARPRNERHRREPIGLGGLITAED